MQIPQVLTVIGADRPGLVEKVAGLVAQHGGNWLESRMCRLGGQFAGIVRVSVPAAARSELARALASLATAGLRVEVFTDDGSSPPAVGPEARLELVGQDRPGIVRQITAALAARHVNVEELASECVSAPMSGEPLFQAKLRLRLPPACDLAELRRELERIAADLQVDVTVEPLTH